MKRLGLWISIFVIFLLFAACGAAPGETEPTEYRVACFGCKLPFASGQLNTDFGLCQDCMIKVGAAYCQSCSAPCYTRDMVRSLCTTCNAALEETTEKQETTTEAQTVSCGYCGYGILPEYMIGDYCVGCYCIRQGMCLHCTAIEHLPDSGHCSYCVGKWFFCADCGKPTKGEEMFLDLCMDCYGQLHSVLVPCPLCGRSIAPGEIRGGYCSSCRAQSDYHEDEGNFATCDYCGVTYGYTDPLIGGACQNCWEGFAGLCETCGRPYRDGDGFESLCYSCQDKYGPKCSVCGADLTYQGGVDGMCYACYDAANSCKNCGTDLTYQNYDGYCYYCHPSFGYVCVICGYEQPSQRPADGICDFCRETE